MPLIRIELIEGRGPDAVQAIADAVHDAMVEAFGVPPRDRYQVIQTHPATRLVVEDTGLGIARTQDVVLIQVFSRPRSQAEKEALYANLARNLEARCGIAPSDVVVSISTNTDADWSFGFGRAQFLTGEL